MSFGSDALSERALFCLMKRQVRSEYGFWLGRNSVGDEAMKSGNVGDALQTRERFGRTLADDKGVGSAFKDLDARLEGRYATGGGITSYKGKSIGASTFITNLQQPTFSSGEEEKKSSSLPVCCTSSSEMETQRRRLFIHLSALSDDEYEMFVLSLKSVFDIDDTDKSRSSRTMMREADELLLEQRTIGVKEVRAWMKGRYLTVKSDVIDKILCLFSGRPLTRGKEPIISGGQFLAALRLLLHVQNGEEILEGNVFIQVKSATDTRIPPDGAQSAGGATAPVVPLLDPVNEELLVEQTRVGSRRPTGVSAAARTQNLTIIDVQPVKPSQASNFIDLTLAPQPEEVPLDVLTIKKEEEEIVLGLACYEMRDESKDANEHNSTPTGTAQVVHDMKCLNCITNKQERCEGPPQRACNHCTKIRVACDYAQRRTYARTGSRKCKSTVSTRSGSSKRKDRETDDEMPAKKVTKKSGLSFVEIRSAEESEALRSSQRVASNFVRMKDYRKEGP
ncbi:hypothetical protein SCHPADRAFT_887917 [Schizopora paradoxa]|uniref:Zn(2)-C6 fungal-type domain-containing protein n=1 Tax=Schizopora paradoxa TaxID=27342 RepID=A0A0H2SGR6_9AGAM|nr:hypothetical protein SCHPADRAFT_887917 [Schizopora paradoxa]